MKTMVILGNGFDKALNYPTGYSDFYKNSRLIRVYAHNGNSLCAHILQHITDGLWSDLETGLYNYSLALTNSVGMNNEVESFKFKKEFDELRDALFNYLNSISGASKELEKQYPAFGLNAEWCKLDPQFLTFNYSTTTLSMASMNKRDFLQPDDHINPDKFIYQHGSIFNTQGYDNDPSSIVLGIDEDLQKVEPMHSFLYKSKQQLFNLNDTFIYIDENDLYIVFGCSIGPSDATYFKYLFNQNGKKFIIFGYGNEGVNSIKYNMTQLCRNFDEFSQSNQVVLLDTQDCTVREQFRIALDSF